VINYSLPQEHDIPWMGYYSPACFAVKYNGTGSEILRSIIEEFFSHGTDEES
jgi:hypothetical protein